MSSISFLGTALGLGAAAGINAWATLLVYGFLARFYPSLFSGDLAEFFASTPVLITVGAAYLVEFVADKVPAVDHVWDLIQTFVRPFAGAVLAFGSAKEEMPGAMMILAAVIGGGAALTTHLGKAALRGASTASTGGLANPFLSLVEDIFAFGQAVLAIFLPWVVLAMLVALMLMLLIWGVKRRGRGDTAGVPPNSTHS
ncbi:MAG: DUF4126 domain-containing protein [Acidobacteria bacterium]|nr:DUF4126 domain-containing protein [Acidobacteriota bacterium]